jgi:hypothetical protein
MESFMEVGQGPNWGFWVQLVFVHLGGINCCVVCFLYITTYVFLDLYLDLNKLSDCSLFSVRVTYNAMRWLLKLGVICFILDNNNIVILPSVICDWFSMTCILI